MVLLEFSMSPLGKGRKRQQVCLALAGYHRQERRGLSVESHGDGPRRRVGRGLRRRRKCYERMKKDCNRISCSIKVDYRKGHSGRLVSKVASVEKTLKRSIRQ